ncbi:MAG: hypothetical protein RIM99_18875 [Cyclobacteriaceae bacterium]
MSINNTFNWKRFLLLFRQYQIHNGKFLLYAIVGYCGVVFIILSLGQLGIDGEPHELNAFLQLLLTFGAIFGILYTGYSFSPFRTKEGTISYLTMPASSLEKFLFEFISRIGLALVMLPFFFWLTFNLQGFVFEMIGKADFDPIWFSSFYEMDISPIDEIFWLPFLIVFASLLTFVLPFTGGAIFSKQPLIKTLFSVAIIMAVFGIIIYIVLEPLGLSNYNVNNSLWLLPDEDESAIRFTAFLAIITNTVMLATAYLKIKEKEV